MRPQWEIDAIDRLDDAREARRRSVVWALIVGNEIRKGDRRERGRWLAALGLLPVKVKKGRGQRRNRRNRRNAR